MSKRGSWRRRLLIVGCLVLGLPGVALATLLLYLNLADLGKYRGHVESLLSEGLGREIRIAEFAPEFGWTSSVAARGVTLANPAWSADPVMLSIDALSIRLDLPSLLFGPIRIHDVRIRGVQLVLESDAAGRSNWQFDPPQSEDSAPGSPPDLVLEHVVIEGLSSTYRSAAREQAVELSQVRVEIEQAPDDMLELIVTARVNDASVELEGRVGPLGGIMRAESLDAQLSGTIAGSEWALSTRVEDLGTLAVVEASLQAHGGELSDLTGSLGLPSIGEGSFRLGVGVAPAGDGFVLSIDAALAEITLEAEGQIDSLLERKSLDLTLDAAGPDLAAVGRLVGAPPLPQEAFRVRGSAHWGGFPVSFDDLRADVGANTLSLDGVLGAPPSMEETSFRFEAAGPDLAAFSAVAGVDLPPGPFRAAGRLARVEQGIRVEALEARVGATLLEAEGIVGDPPALAGTDLVVHATGPALSEFSALAGLDLPPQSFEVGGGLQHTGSGRVALDEVRGRLGDSRFSVSGELHADDGLAGTQLRLRGEGPDLAQIGRMVGRTDLPEGSFRVESSVTVLDEGYALQATSIRLADVTAEATGHVGALPGLVGTDVQVDVRGPDVGWVGRLAELDLPADAFRIAGRVRVTANGYELGQVETTLGDVSARLDGHVGAPPELHGTELTMEIQGPRLASLGAYAERPLPAVPFALTGQVAIDAEGYRLRGVAARLDDNRMTIDGLLVPSDDFAGTRARLAIEGPHLAAVGRLATESGVEGLPELPEDAFSVTGSFGVEDTGYTLQQVVVGLGRGSARLDGRVGSPPEFHGTTLSIEADAMDGSRIGQLAGLELPADPVRAHGRIEVSEAGYAFDDFRLDYGAYSIAVDGRLGELPSMQGTRLDLAARGPTLVLIGDLSGQPELPDEPFEFAGHFEGTPERFSMEGFTARLGASDLRGSFRVDLRGVPDVVGEFRADLVDVTPFLREPGEQAPRDEDESPEPEAQKAPASLLLSDEPFDLQRLRELNAKVSLHVDQLIAATLAVQDVRASVLLQDGEVHLGPLSGREDVGESTGTFEGSVVLQPVGAGFRTEASLHINDFNVDMTTEEDDPADWPQVDLDLELEGTGRSLRTLAADLSGHGEIIVGEGVMDNSVLEILATDLIFTVLSTINPFTREDPTTKLDCIVIATDLRDGKVRLDPLVMRTNKMVMLGHGAVVFPEESLDLEWVTKPRKGIGISMGAFTNALIKLGGTLSDPEVQSKGIEGVAKGSLSMITLGISDRITAERKVCKKALKKLGH